MYKNLIVNYNKIKTISYYKIMNEDANSNRELTFEIEENNVIPTRVEKITRFIKKKKYKTYFTILK